MRATWTVVDALEDADRRDVAALLDEIERRTRDEALTEDQRERLDARRPLRHLLRRDEEGRLTGYAVIAPGDVAEAEPALGSFDDGLATVLERIDEPVTVLLRPADDAVVASLAARGWHQVRALRRMRIALPASPPPEVRGVVVRAFEVGRDDAAWIAQNNAAFARHPTQSHMTSERLAARVAQGWFDPQGFLLFVDGDRLVASCWTKVHEGEGGRVGEIYVISVAPEAQGRGLGRAAVLAGLAHLAGLGISVGELFVEDDNAPAIALYESIGFRTVSRVVELRFDPSTDR